MRRIHSGRPARWEICKLLARGHQPDPASRVENWGLASSAAGAYYSSVFIDIPLHIFLASLTAG